MPRVYRIHRLKILHFPLTYRAYLTPLTNITTITPTLCNRYWLLRKFISFFSIFLNIRGLTAQRRYILWSLCVATLTVDRSKLCNGCNTNVNNDSLHRRSRYSKLQRRFRQSWNIFVICQISDIWLDLYLKIHFCLSMNNFYTS